MLPCSFPAGQVELRLAQLKIRRRSPKTNWGGRVRTGNLHLVFRCPRLHFTSVHSRVQVNFSITCTRLRLRPFINEGLPFRVPGMNFKTSLDRLRRARLTQQPQTRFRGRPIALPIVNVAAGPNLIHPVI